MEIKIELFYLVLIILGCMFLLTVVFSAIVAGKDSDLQDELAHMRRENAELKAELNNVVLADSCKKELLDEQNGITKRNGIAPQETDLTVMTAGL